jgi:hypothetical protein
VRLDAARQSHQIIAPADKQRIARHADQGMLCQCTRIGHPIHRQTIEQRCRRLQLIFPHHRGDDTVIIVDGAGELAALDRGALHDRRPTKVTGVRVGRRFRRLLIHGWAHWSSEAQKRGVKRRAILSRALRLRERNASMFRYSTAIIPRRAGHNGPPSALLLRVKALNGIHHQPDRCDDRTITALHPNVPASSFAEQSRNVRAQAHSHSISNRLMR